MPEKKLKYDFDAPLAGRFRSFSGFPHPDNSGCHPSVSRRAGVDDCRHWCRVVGRNRVLFIKLLVRRNNLEDTKSAALEQNQISCRFMQARNRNICARQDTANLRGARGDSFFTMPYTSCVTSRRGARWRSVASCAASVEYARQENRAARARRACPPRATSSQRPCA